MSKRPQTHIFSIFTQIEEVIANQMINEGKATKIPLERFPPSDVCPDVWVSPEGHHAMFAIIIKRNDGPEFMTRVAALRA